MKKEYLTLKNVLLCFAILVGVVMISVSAAISLTMETEFGNVELTTIIWGTSSGILAGKTYPLEVMLGFTRLPANAFGVMGVIFPLVAALALIYTFFNKNEKINKIVIVCSALFMLVGGIFQFLIIPGFEASLIKAWTDTGNAGGNIEAMAKSVADSAKLSGGSIACGIITIVAAVGAGLAPFVPNKQLIK